MYRKSEFIKDWYKPGEVAKLLGVTPRSILRYKDNNELDMTLDKMHNRWYVSKNSLISFLDGKGLIINECENKVVIIYARVSSHDQKKNGDLDRQIQFIEDECKRRGIFNYIVYSDVASGLNAKRSGLNLVIDNVLDNKVESIYITYRDRLTRFGFEYLERIVRKFDVEIIPLCSSDDKSVQEELVDDMMSLIASFSRRLYGLRSISKKKMNSSINSIPDLED